MKYSYLGKLVQLMSINIDNEINCKVTDGEHWVDAIFASSYRVQFETHRMKENQLLRLINARLDDTNTLKIVSLNHYCKK